MASSIDPSRMTSIPRATERQAIPSPTGPPGRARGISIYDRVSSWFRKRRNGQLTAGLLRLHQQVGRNIRILDVGGVETFWQMIGQVPFAEITIVNLAEAFDKPYWFTNQRPEIRREIGSALDLSHWRNRGIDVVISNSVIEHVGRWAEIERAAHELYSVASHGWVQTPSFSFPIEPHFALPFIHWFSDPIRAELLRFFPHHGAGGLDNIGKARHAIDENNLITARECRFLFPEAVVVRERFLGLTKSLIATWGIMSV